MKWGKVGNFGESGWGRGKIGEAYQDKGDRLKVFHREKPEELND